jgi:hypothetical protein
MHNQIGRIKLVGLVWKIIYYIELLIRILISSEGAMSWIAWEAWFHNFSASFVKN